MEMGQTSEFQNTRRARRPALVLLSVTELTVERNLQETCCFG